MMVFWNGTGVKLFDPVMAPSNIEFSKIGLDDLVGDNSVVLMSEFVQLCARNPPVGRHTNASQDTLSGAVRKLEAKFESQTANLPPLFPDEMVQSWRRKSKDNFNLTMMQGEDESNVLKNTFPPPRKQAL